MRVLVVDDQEKVRSAIRLLLDHEPSCEVSGEAVDVAGLLNWLEVEDADLVLLDWELVNGDARGVLATIRESCPGVGIVALSGQPEARRAALDAGADGFASKGEPPERLLEAIEMWRGSGDAKTRH
jgi:DNA-binding NarL/FixJ family response regulator